MPPLTAAGILQAWERGQGRRPFERALALLAVGEPGEDWERLAQLPIGQRDTRLVALREQSLGSALRAFSRCPVCDAELTFTLQTGDLRTDTPAAEAAEPIELTGDGISVRFRLPATTDFAELPLSADVLTVRRLLAQRCVLEAERDGIALDFEALPEVLIEAISAEMSHRDPQAETTISLSCPTCEHRWSALFDIATFFWAEIAALAKRLLSEVDVLARHYGWREGDILALTAWRRDAYLQLAQA
jgi:hypothetical protein